MKQRSSITKQRAHRGVRVDKVRHVADRLRYRVDVGNVAVTLEALEVVVQVIVARQPHVAACGRAVAGEHRQQSPYDCRAIHIVRVYRRGVCLLTKGSSARVTCSLSLSLSFSLCHGLSGCSTLVTFWNSCSVIPGTNCFKSLSGWFV